MAVYSLSHLSDRTLLNDLAALVARDHRTTAQLLAHIAEVEERKLYLPAAHRSMFAYCVDVLRMSEDVAFKRIRVARAARRFAEIYDAVAEGRLHVSGVVLLAPHLTESNARELLAAATHKTKSQIEHLLAEMFPQRDLPTRVRPIFPSASPSVRTLEPSGELAERKIDAGPNRPSVMPTQGTQLAPGPVSFDATQHDSAENPAAAPERAESAQARIEMPASRHKIAPLSPERFALQLTMSKSTHESLRYAQELLSHQIPSGDLSEVLEQLLKIAVPELEKRKFAATLKPRSTTRSRPVRASVNPRYIPADIKRTVWDRDGGRCTFVSNAGLRCSARKFLEFDHVDEVARGGQATVGGMRLRCRAHNQFTAECTFGTEFMKRKRNKRRPEMVQRA